MKLISTDPLAEITSLINAEISPVLKEKFPGISFPGVEQSRDLSKADFTIICARIASKPYEEFTKRAAGTIQEYCRSLPTPGLVKSCVGVGPYVNLNVDRRRILKLVVENVQLHRAAFGRSEIMRGKRVIVEHTSTNPNAPLHVGNLRNSILGSHLAKLLEAVGYECEQRFLVNDLGAQISLTVVGFSRIHGKVQPHLKMDQWIGQIYAMMNTFKEVQVLGLSLVECADVTDIEPFVQQKCDEPEKAKKMSEYLTIFNDRRTEHPGLFVALLKECLNVPDIAGTAAQLGLDYENRVPEAVRQFRDLVVCSLSGQQETLDTYRVRHSAWDFESEMVWDGSTERALSEFKKSPYWVDRTEKEGAYLDLDRYIRDRGLPVGKKGYAKDYPRLYILRPNGSTLYYMRDIVYSLKKAEEAPLVLNVICSEQKLAQDKVVLGMSMLRPEVGEHQYHFSYELVKVMEAGQVKRMSGRRGQYELADDLYMALREQVDQKMKERVQENLQSGRGGSRTISEEEHEKILHEVSTAAMKYALLATDAHNVINFDLEKVTSFQDGSAPFLLYNATRFASLFEKFEKKRQDDQKRYPDALKACESCDFSVLGDAEVNQLWKLLMTYVLQFAYTIRSAALPRLPPRPGVPDYCTHRICDFLNLFVRDFSTFYKAFRILDLEQNESVHVRLHIMDAFYQVVVNAMNLLTIEPLERM